MAGVAKQLADSNQNTIITPVLNFLSDAMGSIREKVKFILELFSWKTMSVYYLPFIWSYMKMILVNCN